MNFEEGFRNGLIDRNEYMGYLKGTATECILGCEKEDNPIDELDRAVQYILKMYYLIGSEKLGISIDEFKKYSEVLDALKNGCECNECKNR